MRSPHPLIFWFSPTGVHFGPLYLFKFSKWFGPWDGNEYCIYQILAKEARDSPTLSYNFWILSPPLQKHCSPEGQTAVCSTEQSSGHSLATLSSWMRLLFLLGDTSQWYTLLKRMEQVLHFSTTLTLNEWIFWTGPNFWSLYPFLDVSECPIWKRVGAESCPVTLTP